MKDFLCVGATILTLVAGIFIVVGLIMGVPLYIKAERSAQLYNQAHNTTFTTWDFFFAADQINKSTSTLNIQPLERQR